MPFEGGDVGGCHAEKSVSEPVEGPTDGNLVPDLRHILVMGAAMRFAATVQVGRGSGMQDGMGCGVGTVLVEVDVYPPGLHVGGV